MPGIPRRHHYVTKAYLDGFLELHQHHFYCYRRSRRDAFRTSTHNVANIRDFHTFRKPDGSLDFSVEMMIESQIETPGLPVIRKLAARDTSLNATERHTLARLIALQHVRVPYERDFIDRQNKENLESYLEDMDLATARVGRPVNAIDVAVSPTAEFPNEKSWVRITRVFLERELRAIAADPGKSSREVFFNIADGVGKIFAQMEWRVGYASGHSRFVTSDRPVVRTVGNGATSHVGINEFELRDNLSSVKHLCSPNEAQPCE